MHLRRILVTSLIFAAFSLAAATTARADSINALTFSVASPTRPNGTGTSIQSSGVLEVGTIGNNSEVRGLLEFDLTGQTPGRAFMTFNFLRPTGNSGQAFYDGDIDVYLYAGNNAIDLSDFEAPAVFRARFNVIFASGGDVSLELTDFYNEALARGVPALGVRFQPVSLPDNSAAQFYNFKLGTPQTPTPEPATIILLRSGLAALVLKAGRRRGAASKRGAGVD